MGGVPAFCDRGVVDAPGPSAAVRNGTASVSAALVDEVLTDTALVLLGTMSRVHDHARRGLLEARAARAERLAAGEPLGLDPSTEWIREGEWSVSGAPPDLTDRRVEITGPVDRKMMV